MRIKRKITAVSTALLAVVLICVSFPMAVLAQTSDFTYSIKNGTAVITGYNGTSESVDVPANIDGHTVTEIGEWSFSEKSIKSVSLPDTVTKIGSCAFFFCMDLETVRMPSRLTVIDDDAFNQCRSLREITIPSTVKEIGSFAFAFCDDLAKVNYTGTVDQWVSIKFESGRSSPMHNGGTLYIGGAPLTYAKITASSKVNDYAFYQYKALKSASVGVNVKSIGKSSFEDCTGLTTVNISGAVQTIGETAFKECTSLSALTLSEGIKTINVGAFYGCTALKRVNVPNSVTYIGARALGFYNSKGAHAVVPDFLLTCHSGTAAEQYAIDHKLKSYVFKAAAPKITSLSLSGNRVKLTWEKKAGVDGYLVYRKVNNGSYKLIKKISGANSCTLYDSVPDSYNCCRLRYAVKSYKDKATSHYSEKSTMLVLSPKISIAANNYSGSVSLRWTGNGRATGYQVMYVCGGAKKTVNVSGYANVSKLIKNLTKGKTYRFYVRTYKTFDGETFYSRWSSCRAVTISK